MPDLVNNSRRDPTRTTVLRAEYSKAMRSRFGALKNLVNETVIENDALGLKPTGGGTLPVLLKAKAAQRYDFPSDPAGKAQAFLDWLMAAADEDVLEIIRYEGRRVAERNAWQNTYVRGAYGRGIEMATTALRQAGLEIPDYSLAGVFNQPMHAEILGLLFTRNFDELKGITDVMGQQIARTLAEGLASGVGPREVARLIVERVEKIGITRATTLARTEIIRAHAEATLSRYEEFGIDEANLLAEFSHSGDKKVCEICLGLASQDNGLGKGVYKLSQARGMIPAHPNCRCAWLPVLPGLATNRKKYFVNWDWRTKYLLVQ